MYRLRSLDKLLKEDYQELERQTIYFTPFSDLNDPMEGVIDIIFQGDSIVWKNLFRHYLLCLDWKVALATINDPEHPDQFFKYKIPIFISEKELPIDLYRQHFKVIKDRFFANTNVALIIDYLHSRKTPLRIEQLSTILHLFSKIALESVLFGHDKSGYQPQSFFPVLQDLIRKNPMNIEQVLNAPDTTEEMFDKSMANANMMNREVDLIFHCRLGEKANRINWSYFFIDFPTEYLAQMPQLVYPYWYSASFMSEFPENSILWSHYAEAHKGVCLIFNTDPKDEYANPYISLGQLSGEKMIETSNKSPTFFEKVNYTNEREKVDFFKRLWTQPQHIVVNEWYTDENGQKSSLISEASPKEDVRLEYWEKFKRIQTTKTMSWQYENEYRLVLDNFLFEFERPQSRTLKYDFKSLEGIIFGIRTPTNKKVRIIEIVHNKCKSENRNDFKFYQARFDELESKVVFDELTLLKFK